jgi:hypothetical protein
VEADPAVDDHELGHNALLFRDMLLAMPGFDDMPAWTKYPEGSMPGAVGLLEMWRDGVSLSTVFGWVWKSISPRVSPLQKSLRERSSFSLEADLELVRDRCLSWFRREKTSSRTIKTSSRTMSLR